MEYKVIDNFLPQELFKKIKDQLTISQMIPWYYNDRVAGNNDGPFDYYFTHLFYADYVIKSEYFSIFKDLISKLNAKSLIRVKGNFYPHTPEIVHHANHTDYDYPHNAAVFYVNTNNGSTVLNDDVVIESKENRILLFNPLIPHHSTTCSDERFRITINFNYF